MSDNRARVAIIGAGLFGSTIAIALSYIGYKVVLLERLPDILMGTTKNNTCRIHQGFHYPRDLNTARMCKINFKKFINTCHEAVLSDFPNIYCISSEGSLTSAQQYLHFCDSVGLTYSKIDLDNYLPIIRDCTLGLSCGEAVLDTDILRRLIITTIQQHDNITVCCNTDILEIRKMVNGYELTTQTKSKMSFDVVINCSYAAINNLTMQLGYKVPKYQFEYTFIPILDLDLPPQGITIMDGPFMTLFPYGKSGKFTLYHVQHSVVATEINNMINKKWLNPETAPFSGMNKSELFKEMLSDCSAFLPILKESKLAGFLEGPRMVLADHDKDDARPSILQDHGENYLTVFSGKLDHFFTIIDSICKALKVSKSKQELFRALFFVKSSSLGRFFG